MLYLVKYKDGFIVGADGKTPQAALDRAEAATARAFDQVDQLTERDTTFVVYDCTRGWLAPRAAARSDAGLVDVNTGDVVAGALAEPEKVAGIDVDPPSDAVVESSPLASPSPEATTSETES